MDTGILNAALVATVLAMLVVLYEMRASLQPTSCAECPHCQALALEKARRDQELQTWYAREHRIDGDEDDERRI